MNRPRFERGFFIFLSMGFTAGERVCMLDEDRAGSVLEVQGEGVLVQWDDGFEQWVEASDLVKEHGFIDPDMIGSPNAFGQEGDRPQEKPRSSDERALVDLHAGAFLFSTRGMNDHEILMEQMNELRSAFEKAKSERRRRLIIIHGVGSGRLRSEVERYLNRQQGIEFYDASFREFGQGATEVCFYKF